MQYGYARHSSKYDFALFVKIQVHQLFQGPAGTTVKIKYMRPPNKFEISCTLMRESGTGSDCKNLFAIETIWQIFETTMLRFLPLQNTF